MGTRRESKSTKVAFEAPRSIVMGYVLYAFAALFVWGDAAIAKPTQPDILGTYRSGVLPNGAKATLKLERVDKWIVGQLTDEKGRVFALRGKGDRKFVEGKIFLENRSVSFVLERVGASVFLSYSTFDSRGRTAAQRSILMRKMQQASVHPGNAHSQVAAFSTFLKSYQDLSDKKVAARLTAFDPGLRNLVQIFGYLHTDLYARVCTVGRELAVTQELGWPQSLSCDELRSRWGAAKNADQRIDLAKRARKQAFALADVVGCTAHKSVPQLHSPCDRLGVTLSPIASAWQDASAILPHQQPVAPTTAVAMALVPRLKPQMSASVVPVIPVLNPLRVASAHETHDPLEASLDFRKLPVTYRSMEMATLHEWSLAHGDGPHAAAEEAVGAVDPQP